MEHIVRAFKFTFKHPLIIVILIILSSLIFLIFGFSSPTGKAPRVPFIALVLYIPAILFIVYCIAGAYSILWKMFSGCQEISVRMFIQGAKRYFWIITKIGIIVIILTVLISLPGCIRTYTKIKGGDTGYVNTVEGWLLTIIPSLIIMCLFAYVTPYIFVFDVHRVAVIGKGCKFFIKHFLISVPIIALYVITYMVSKGINQVATLFSSPSTQYRLVQSSGYFIHFYLSIIIFLSAAQILKKYHREEDEERVCSDV